MFKEIIKTCLNPFVLIYFKIKLHDFIILNKNFNRFLVLDIDNRSVSLSSRLGLQLAHDWDCAGAQASSAYLRDGGTDP